MTSVFRWNVPWQSHDSSTINIQWIVFLRCLTLDKKRPTVSEAFCKQRSKTHSRATSQHRGVERSRAVCLDNLDRSWQHVTQHVTHHAPPISPVQTVPKARSHHHFWHHSAQKTYTKRINYRGTCNILQLSLEDLEWRKATMGQNQEVQHAHEKMQMPIDFQGGNGWAKKWKVGRLSNFCTL